MAPRRRTIAILFEFPTLNGGERSMLQSLDQLDRSEFQVVALAPPSGRLATALQEREIEQRPFHFHSAEGERLPREALVEQLLDHLQHITPDVLHANSLAMGRLTGAVADRCPARTYAHLRDIIKLSGATIKDLNRNDQLLAVSQATSEFHIQQGLDADRTSVLFNGVDCQRFQPRSAATAFRRELGLGADSVVALTVGQIGLRKGQDVLAAAATRIVERVPNVQFVVVGERNSTKPESVAFEQKLRDDFQTAKLVGRLHLLGYREDVHRLMNAADLLVHPAKQEPLGRVLLEAAASGLPIVATDVGGTSEILKAGASAELVAPGDPAALAAAVINLAQDARLRKRMSSAARQTVLEGFNATFAADRLAEVWRA